MSRIQHSAALYHVTSTSHPKATIEVNSVHNFDKHSGRDKGAGFFMGCYTLSVRILNYSTATVDTITAKITS